MADPSDDSEPPTDLEANEFGAEFPSQSSSSSGAAARFPYPGDYSGYDCSGEPSYSSDTMSMELDDSEDDTASSDLSTVECTPISTFDELNISAELVSALNGAGFTTPNSLQAQILPRILQTHLQNALVQSISASGKTLCFLLAMLSQVSVADKVPQALCVCPTRELALQIHHVLTQIVQNTQITTLCAVGVDFDRLEQIQNIMMHLDHHIIVGTTGVLVKALLQKKLDLSSLKVLVFDEFDDFWDKVLLFSSTFSQYVRKQISSLLAINIEIVDNKDAYRFHHLKQYKVACVDFDDKAIVIQNKVLALGRKVEKVIIFFLHQADGDKLCKLLVDAKYSVRCLQLYGKLLDRDVVLKEFREGKFNILIASDIIARGFDDPKVNLVINFNLPVKHDAARIADGDLYLHRIGRAGRIGQKSCTFNLFDEDDVELMTSIEKDLDLDVQEVGDAMDSDGEIDDMIEYVAALDAADLL